LLLVSALIVAQAISVVDATEKVYRDDVSLPSPAASAAIDAAQNEFEGFQIVVTGPASNVSVSANTLTGPGGFPIVPSSAGRQGNIMVYREAFIALPGSGAATDPAAKEGNAPDALIPQFDEFYQEARNTAVATLPAGQNAVYFVDVHVPPEANPGVYAGTVTVSANGASHDVPVTLTVWPFALPSTPTLKTVIRFGWDAATLQYPSLSGQCCGDTVAQMHLLHAMLGVNHRVNIHAFDYGNPDLNAYQRNFGALINGTANTLLSGAHPTVLQYLGTHGSSNTLASWRSFFAQNGWLDYLVDYAADEPAAGANSNWCTLSANAAADAAANVRSVTTASIEDARAATCNGQAVNLGAINVFAPVVDQVQPLSMGTGQSTMGDYSAWRAGSLNGVGNEVWEYQSCDTWGCADPGNASGWPSYAIDHAAIRSRALEWISFRNGISGEVYWAADDSWTDLTRAPWTNQYASGGNGDGTLIYPGVAASAQVGGTHDIPLASLRLKMLREGVEDYEYMSILGQLGDASFVDSQIDGVFPTAHSVAGVSPAVLYGARAELACRIVVDRHPNWTCDPSTWGTVTLTVSTSGIGTGTITSSPAGIDCGTGGTSCAARFAAGTTVTLLATPDSGSTFGGFSGGCAGAQSSCALDLASEETVVGSFGLPPAHLTAGPAAVSFDAVQVGSAPPAQAVILLDDGGQALAWTATSDDGAISLSASSGSLAAGASAGVTVSVAAQAAAGSRTSHLTIVAGAAGTITLPVSITFTAAPPPPPPPAQLLVTPLSLSFQAQAGEAPAARSIIVSDVGGVGTSFGISTDDSAVVPAISSFDLGPGEGKVVQVSVTPSAVAGARSANLVVNAGAAGTVTIAVSVAFTAPPDGPDAGPSGPDAGPSSSNTGGADGGTAPPIKESNLAPAQGCSHDGTTAGWLAALGALALFSRKRRE